MVGSSDSTDEHAATRGLVRLEVFVIVSHFRHVVILTVFVAD